MNLTADLAIKRVQGNRTVRSSKEISLHTKSIETSMACPQFWGQHLASRKRPFDALDQARAKQQKVPQVGAIKDLTTTTIGAALQPGSVSLTLMPADDGLFADVAIKNEDIGFVQTGQSVQIKLAAFPFQKYGLIAGKLVHVSADASGPNRAGNNQQNLSATTPIYKVRIALEEQFISSPIDNKKFNASAGTQAAVEIHQGRQTVMEYLLSPVTKAAQEAGREK